jgi:hypothetical protein
MKVYVSKRDIHAIIETEGIVGLSEGHPLLGPGWIEAEVIDTVSLNPFNRVCIRTLDAFGGLSDYWVARDSLLPAVSNFTDAKLLTDKGVMAALDEQEVMRERYDDVLARVMKLNNISPERFGEILGNLLIYVR